MSEMSLKKFLINNQAYYRTLIFFMLEGRPFYSYKDIQTLIGKDAWKDNLKPILLGKKAIKIKKSAFLDKNAIIENLTDTTKKQLNLKQKTMYFSVNRERLNEALFQLYAFFLERESETAKKHFKKKMKSAISNFRTEAERRRMIYHYDHPHTITQLFAEGEAEKHIDETTSIIQSIYKFTKQSVPTADEQAKIYFKTKIKEKKKAKKNMKRLFAMIDGELDINAKGFMKNTMAFEAFKVDSYRLMRTKKAVSLDELFKSIMEYWSEDYKLVQQNRLGDRKIPFVYKQCQLIIKLGRIDKKN